MAIQYIGPYRIRPADQDLSIKSSLSERAAVTVLMPALTGELYFDTDKPNPVAQPYAISAVTLVLNDVNQLEPFDILEFRVAVPEYFEIEHDLTDIAHRARGLFYERQNAAEAERGRVSAQQAKTLHGLSALPTKPRTPDAYDPDDPAQGLRPKDAADLLHEYLNRFDGGTVLVVENAQRTLKMLDRIGAKVATMPNVYHKVQDLYGMFTASLIAGGDFAGFDELPGLEDVVELTDPYDLRERTLSAATFLVDLTGEGNIPAGAEVLDVVVDTVSDVKGRATITLGNSGIGHMTIDLAAEGLEGFDPQLTPSTADLTGAAEAEEIELTFSLVDEAMNEVYTAEDLVAGVTVTMTSGSGDTFTAHLNDYLDAT